jgi:hypothetical protein
MTYTDRPVPIIVEPIELPKPAREPDREPDRERPPARDPVPSQPSKPTCEPAPA